MINEDELRKTIADNLIKYRKLNNLTQTQLAEKLNYSDKAISKWERAESFPDIVTLANIAELYNITLNDLLSEEIPTNGGKIKDNKKFTHIFVPILSIGIAVFVAVILFVTLSIIGPKDKYSYWMCFIYIIPIIGIIGTVFSALWCNDIYTGASVSIILWGVILCIFLTLLQMSSLEDLWLIFLIGAGFQILIIVWFLMKILKKRKKTRI